MSELANQHSLVDELDTRQNEVLLQLDDLNMQIESLLAEYLVANTPSDGVSPHTASQEAA